MTYSMELLHLLVDSLRIKKVNEALLKALLPYWHDIIYNSTHYTKNEIEHNFWNLINIDFHIEYIT